MAARGHALEGLAGRAVSSAYFGACCQPPERKFLLFDGPGGATGIDFFWALGLIFARKREKKLGILLAFWGGVFALFGGGFCVVGGVE